MNAPYFTELEWADILGSLTIAEILMEKNEDPRKQAQVERLRAIKSKIYTSGVSL